MRVAAGAVVVTSWRDDEATRTRGGTRRSIASQEDGQGRNDELWITILQTQEAWCTYRYSIV